MTARRLPLLALALVASSGALLCAPGLAEALSFERERLAREPWRLLSGHLVHDPALATVDLTVLLVLGAWWELRSRARFAWILLVSAGFASLALVVCTSFARYTGSSALGSGLLLAAALSLALEPEGRARWLGWLLVAAFAAKCALELSGAGALFVDLPEGMHLAAAAHAAGGLGGGLVALAGRRVQGAGVRPERQP